MRWFRIEQSLITLCLAKISLRVWFHVSLARRSTSNDTVEPALRVEIRSSSFKNRPVEIHRSQNRPAVFRAWIILHKCIGVNAKWRISIPDGSRDWSVLLFAPARFSAQSRLSVTLVTRFLPKLLFCIVGNRRGTGHADFKSLSVARLIHRHFVVLCNVECYLWMAFKNRSCRFHFCILHHVLRLLFGGSGGISTLKEWLVDCQMPWIHWLSFYFSFSSDSEYTRMDIDEDDICFFAGKIEQVSRIEYGVSHYVLSLSGLGYLQRRACQFRRSAWLLGRDSHRLPLWTWASAIVGRLLWDGSI